MGWFASASEVLRGEQRVIAERAEAREAKAAEKAQAERQERAEARLFAAQHGGAQPTSPGERMAAVSAVMDRADAAEAARRHVADCGCDRCDTMRYTEDYDRATDKATGPGLDRIALKREQAAREAELSPTDHRVRELEERITRLNARLSAKGIDPLPGKRVKRDRPVWSSP